VVLVPAHNRDLAARESELPHRRAPEGTGTEDLALAGTTQKKEMPNHFCAKPQHDHTEGKRIAGEGCHNQRRLTFRRNISLSAAE